MVVVMMKWSSWGPAHRKFHVNVKPLKLEGLDHDFWTGKVMAIRVKWNVKPLKLALIPFYRSSSRKVFSREKIVEKGKSWVQWDDEFEFSLVSSDDHKCSVSFSILYGEAKGKMRVIGKGSVNVAELASKMEFHVERKLPLNLQAAGFVGEEATSLSVLVSFVEMRDSQDPAELMARNIQQKDLVVNGRGHIKKKKKQQLSQDEVSLNDSFESTRFHTGGTESRLSPNSKIQLDQVKFAPFFSWKRFKSRKERVNNNSTGEYGDGYRIPVDQQLTKSSCSDSVTSSLTTQKADATESSQSECQSQNHKAGNWEAMEVISRDGQTKLKAQLFFASFDQCSDKAAGESACTALVAVITHWLQINQNRMPTGPEFDSLIIYGSSEWRKLCNDEAVMNNFPDKHFDLETILHAHLRPIIVLHEKSFVGFFSPEKFHSLKGAMSFDEIWDEISIMEDENEPKIYIVSWNDHFFVFKVDKDACYIIDTLGERLFEGCKQAYILKFDNSTLMLGKSENENVPDKEIVTESGNSKESEEVICSGKDCCREFIKKFLAGVVLKELECEEEKETVSYYSLHQRLQIEFNFSSSLSTVMSPPVSSRSSSGTISLSSLFSEEE